MFFCLLHLLYFGGCLLEGASDLRTEASEGETEGRSEYGASDNKRPPPKRNKSPFEPCSPLGDGRGDCLPVE